MLPIIFRPGAQAEMREAYAWYEEREPGLGSNFMRCIDACLQLIRRHPEIFPTTHKNIRQDVLRRFPCSIFYIPTKEDRRAFCFIPRVSRNDGSVVKSTWKRPIT
jgi:plasmid stabilization system protein ParE